MADERKTPRRGPSIKRWLESWIWIYDLFGFVILSSILKHNTDFAAFFREWSDLVSSSRWADYFSKNGLSPVLGVEIIAIFYLGKAFAKKNVDMLVSLFSSDRVPQSLQMDSRQFTLMLVFNFVLFVGLECAINFPWIVCLTFAVLSIFYLRFNWIQRRVIPAVLSDRANAVREDDPHAPFIERRRRVTSRYLFERPHTLRESIVLIASLVGLGLTGAQRFYGFPSGDTLAYAALIVGILLNELLVGAWRRSANQDFDDIDHDQMDDDDRRAEERRNQR